MSRYGFRVLRVPMATLLFLTFSASTFARGQFWNFLGYLQFDCAQTHGRVWMTRRNIPFRSIQLRVSGEAVFFDRLVVHFEDGTSQELLVSNRIAPGGRNFVINLLGEHALESVELWYYKESWVHKPAVSVYGTCLPEPGGETVGRAQ